MQAEHKNRLYYFAAPSANRFLQQQGIDQEKLNEMILKSSPVQHEHGNQQFQDWIFAIEGRRVTWVTKDRPSKPPIRSVDNSPADCDTCEDSGRVFVFNVCYKCNGASCYDCDDGLIPGSIKCPDCNPSPRKIR